MGIKPSESSKTWPVPPVPRRERPAAARKLGAPWRRARADIGASPKGMPATGDLVRGAGAPAGRAAEDPSDFLRAALQRTAPGAVRRGHLCQPAWKGSLERGDAQRGAGSGTDTDRVGCNCASSAGRRRTGCRSPGATVSCRGRESRRSRRCAGARSRATRGTASGQRRARVRTQACGRSCPLAASGAMRRWPRCARRWRAAPSCRHPQVRTRNDKMNSAASNQPSLHRPDIGLAG